MDPAAPQGDPGGTTYRLGGRFRSRAGRPGRTGCRRTRADAVEPDATEPADADPAPDESYDHEVGQTGSVTVAELLRAYGGGGTGRRRRRLDDDDQA